jgi:hypothetical protein
LTMSRIYFKMMSRKVKHWGLWEGWSWWIAKWLLPSRVS